MAQDIPETSPAAQGKAAPPAAAVRCRAAPAEARRIAAAWLRATPGTHLWLLILVLTSLIAVGLPQQERSYLLHHISTNVVELHRHPVRVLIASALWLQAPSGVVLYGVLFEAVHATAERWLGTVRWLTVAAVAHIGATLVSQKAVLFDIRDDRLPHSLAYTVDIGVSYGLAGVAGVLTYRLPMRWRWPYAAALLAYFGCRLARGGTFTDLGHVSAVLIGLCCYALTPPAPARPPVPEPPLSDRPAPGLSAPGQPASEQPARGSTAP